jgi:hypothetical protein
MRGARPGMLGDAAVKDGFPCAPGLAPRRHAPLPWLEAFMPGRCATFFLPPGVRKSGIESDFSSFPSPSTDGGWRQEAVILTHGTRRRLAAK